MSELGPSPEGLERDRLVIVGPTPPPYHGMSVYTEQILGSPRLGEEFEVVHLETADRRSLDNMGRFDLQNLYLGLAHAWKLARLIRRRQRTLVYIEISQNEWAYLRDAVLIGVARLRGARVVTHLHGSYLREFYEKTTPFHRWVVHLTSGWLEGAAVLGQGLRSIYTGLVPEDRIYVVPNGVEDLFPTGLPERPVRAGATPSILYLGALSRAKGVLDLLTAVKDLRRAGIPFHLVLAGGWASEEDRREIEAVIEVEELGENISLPGVVSGETKREVLREADLLVFPGIQAEGLPLVILEAMSAGLPVIATPRGAIEDAVVPGQTGEIVPVGDPIRLAQAISDLIGDPELCAELGRAGRARFLDHFTSAAAEGHLIDMLLDVRSRCG